MKISRKILLYVPVAFVLIFLGKISKAELYRAYFQTIEDVEIRNSQDLEQSKVRLSKEFFADNLVEPVVPPAASLPNAPLTPSLTRTTSAGFWPVYSVVLPLPLPFLASMPTRAP